MEPFITNITRLLLPPTQNNSSEKEEGMSPVQNISNTLRSMPPTALADDISNSLMKLAEGMRKEGMSEVDVVSHVKDELERGFARGQSGPRYFGFVTGGALPAAQCGDIMATCYDQNVQVHLPTETISTALEHRTLDMVLDLLSIPRNTFPGRSLTTGATASNILGLACARDFVIQKALNDPNYSVSQDGFPSQVKIRVLTDRHHASIEKAAAVVGIGRRALIDLSQLDSSSSPSIEEMNFAARLRDVMMKDKKEEKGVQYAYIVVASCAEVNTGDFTDMKGVREVCDEYGAWLHIDAAFGALACLLPEYTHISKDLASADSVTTDGHKWFNVPYACGVFFCRDVKLQTSILAGPSTPAYLTSTETSLTSQTEWIPSPLHTNLENSRRFIALPLYCALLNQGKEGYTKIVKRNVQFARDLAAWMGEGEEGGKWYECLNLRKVDNETGVISVPLNIVLFRARDLEGVPERYRSASRSLITDINALKEIYVSPGVYMDDRGAVRIAVSNWMTGYDDHGEDLERTKGALRRVMISEP